MKKKINEWISISDLMSALMMVFMLIMVALLIPEKQKNEKILRALEENSRISMKIQNSVKKEFKKEFSRWSIPDLKDGTIRFSPSHKTILFKTNRDTISKRFKKVLRKFCPKYINLLKSNFKEHIKEIQITGHASSEGGYQRNLVLSTKRAMSVYNHCYEISGKNKNWFANKAVAKGASIIYPVREKRAHGKTFFLTENKKKSRRVEFRVMTNAEQSFVGDIRGGKWLRRFKK